MSETVDRKDILLTVTVPNVYSLPHAESLKELSQQMPRGTVDDLIYTNKDAVV